MLFALLVGSAMIVASLAISIILFDLAGRMLRWLNDTNMFGYNRLPLIFDLNIAAIWILFVLTCSVWGWAVLYMTIGLFDALEPALYFSIVSFTTVGYGDVVLPEEWRLLAGLTATHGLLTFGLFTAFLVEIFNFPTRARRV
ncbi:ion channel [Sulfitobacter donghicola]|uniref:Metal transporter n=1 Tax=Sulfitobacter donghicola DSW-25 = KCTC 12864 = JCM 14565 TaxID=1300350 RepID=A0A073IFP5_9RHOB|nr:ion channel [Sulfitobacter donghicola]KEJ88544.1 metal transporter [Sulfitobacter donghicola DSW-25 = KCTC 12864 = JCM 14565]KIN69571.1 Ion transport 2 protein [Sulfitobacter donghicola DSW-25 = KCTC 12864 = JCM 14565]